MVKSSIDNLLDTPLDDFTTNNSFGWSRGRGRGGAFKRGAGSWRGRGTRGRTYVSGLASNIPSSRWRENSVSTPTDLPDLQSNWRGGLTRSRRTRTEEIRSTKRKRRKAPPVISTAGEIIVTGLDSSITSDDIRDIFGKRIGVATKAYVVFDKSGKSKGEAHVTFAKRSDARKAVEKLDEAIVDDKKIRVRLLTSNNVALREESSSSEGEIRQKSVPRPRSSRVSRVPSIRKGRGFEGDARASMSRRPTGSTYSSSVQRSRFEDIPPDISNPLDRANTLQMNAPIGRGRGRGSGGYRGIGRARGRGRGWFSNRGRGRGGGGGNWDDSPVTVEDLDRDLDSYLK